MVSATNAGQQITENIISARPSPSQGRHHVRERYARGRHPCSTLSPVVMSRTPLVTSWLNRVSLIFSQKHGLVKPSYFCTIEARSSRPLKRTLLAAPSQTGWTICLYWRRCTLWENKLRRKKNRPPVEFVFTFWLWLITALIVTPLGFRFSPLTFSLTSSLLSLLFFSFLLCFSLISSQSFLLVYSANLSSPFSLLLFYSFHLSSLFLSSLSLSFSRLSFLSLFFFLSPSLLLSLLSFSLVILLLSSVRFHSLFSPHLSLFLIFSFLFSFLFFYLLSSLSLSSSLYLSPSFLFSLQLPLLFFLLSLSLFFFSSCLMSLFLYLHHSDDAPRLEQMRIN